MVNSVTFRLWLEKPPTSHQSGQVNLDFWPERHAPGFKARSQEPTASVGRGCGGRHGQWCGDDAVMLQMNDALVIASRRLAESGVHSLGDKRSSTTRRGHRWRSVGLASLVSTPYSIYPSISQSVHRLFFINRQRLFIRYLQNCAVDGCVAGSQSTVTWLLLLTNSLVIAQWPRGH